MKVVADLHIHSRFSRAVSSQMVVPTIAEWAKKKGIGIVGSGDWTHPLWFRELQANLTEAEDGLFKVRKSKDDSTRFILSTELSSIYSVFDKARRVHYLVFAPTFSAVAKINKTLGRRGVNLLSDGRPIMGLSPKEVLEMILDVNDKCFMIPAHVWTPWFSLYGSKSGFDSIEECFDNLSKHIGAVETGLSSDPAMNWRFEELNKRQIVSFGDAHSPQKLGREATVFELEKLDYGEIRNAITGKAYGLGSVDHGKRAVDDGRLAVSGSEILHTIEFYPEEGKYHYTGHRKCGVVYSPNETRKKGTVCPVCGKLLTVGVASRVESLAKQEIEIETQKDEFGVRWIKDRKGNRSKYVMLVPLSEIIAESLGVGVGAKAVLIEYNKLINTFGSEFKVLLEASTDEMERTVDAKIIEGIKRVRGGDIFIEPGFDGVFGKVKIWKDKEEDRKDAIDQKMLF